MSDFGIIDHTDEVKNKMAVAMKKALEEIGQKAESNAKMEITAMKAVDTGNLRNSITHTADEESAIIGSAVEYAGYVELGTSRMAARPYLKNAVQKYTNEYKEIMQKELNDI